MAVAWPSPVHRVVRVRDPLIAVVVTLWYAVELGAWGPAHPLSAYSLAAVGGVGLALRRRLPLAAFLLVAVSIRGLAAVEPGFDNDSAALIVSFVLALFALARYGAGIERWLGAVAVAVFAILFAYNDAGPGGADAGDLGFAALVVGAPWAVGLAVQLRREREAALTARNEVLEKDQELRARAAVAAERARIARELHDVVSHAIAVTVLQARGARKMLGTDDDAVRQALDAIEVTNSQALSDMRRLLSLLSETDNSPTLRPQPSLRDLPTLVDQLRSAGLPVDLTVSGDPVGVPPGVDLSAYRIVQEALTNVLKHAGPGATATVEVVVGDRELEVVVRDDGPSPPAANLDAASGNARSRGGHGLVGIRQRVAVVGGRVEAGPAPSGGFAVRARLPYGIEP